MLFIIFSMLISISCLFSISQLSKERHALNISIVSADITVYLKSLLKPGSQVCFKYSDLILNYEYQLVLSSC